MTQENIFKHLQRLKVLLLNDNDLKERYALLRQVKTPNGYRLPKNNNGYVAHVEKTLYNCFVKVTNNNISPNNWLNGYMVNDIFDYDGFLIDFISFFNDLKDSNHG
jgi:hypothetical protein